MSRAEEREAAGRLDEAAALYAQAAQSEAEALERVPVGRPRTRGIVGLSAVSLYIQAGQALEGLQLAYQLLADRALPDDAREQLLDLALDAERERQAAHEGRQLSGETFVISLRGESVRAGGLVPLDTVVLKLQQFRGYLVRVGEWIGHRPFRLKGSAPLDVLRACVPLISPATIGSYRFELRLEAPTQLELFDPERTLSPDAVAREFFEVLREVTSDDPEFKSHVNVPEYRDAFMKLIRALVPDGNELVEVEVARKRTGTAAVLRPEMREMIQRRVLADQAPADRDNVRYGVLRALHLDEGWLILVEDGREHRCRIERGRVLDDVVGPLVNRRVAVTGRWRGKVRPRFEAMDIFEWDGQTMPTPGDSRQPDLEDQRGHRADGAFE